MLDINALVYSISGHCTLCHKKSNISIMNGGICMADKLDLDETCDNKGVDELLEKNGILYQEGDLDYQENHEGNEVIENEETN